MVFSVGLRIGSKTLQYRWSGVLSCIEKNGKFKILCLMFRTVWFCWRNISRMIGPVAISITMKIPWNSISPTSNLSSIVLLGVSSCPFAAFVSRFGGGSSRITYCGERNRIFRRSISGTARNNVPVSIRPSMVITPKSIGKDSMGFLHLRLILVENGIQSGSISFVIRTFWNCFSSNRDCGVVSLMVSAFLVPKGLGTLDSWCHRSCANFQSMLLFFCCALLAGSRGLFFGIVGCHQGRAEIAISLGFRFQCPSRGLCRNMGRYTLGCNRQLKECPWIGSWKLLYHQDPKQQLLFDTNMCYCK